MEDWDWTGRIRVERVVERKETFEQPMSAEEGSVRDSVVIPLRVYRFTAKEPR